MLVQLICNNSSFIGILSGIFCVFIIFDNEVTKEDRILPYIYADHQTKINLAVIGILNFLVGLFNIANLNMGQIKVILVSFFVLMAMVIVKID